MSGPPKLSAKAEKLRAEQKARQRANQKAQQKVQEVANREKCRVENQRKEQLEAQYWVKRLAHKKRVLDRLDAAAERDRDPEYQAKLAADKLKRQPKWMKAVVVTKKVGRREIPVRSGLMPGSIAPSPKP